MPWAGGRRLSRQVALLGDDQMSGPMAIAANRIRDSGALIRAKLYVSSRLEVNALSSIDAMVEMAA